MVIPTNLQIGDCPFAAADFGIDKLSPAHKAQSAAAITALIIHGQGEIAKILTKAPEAGKAFVAGRPASPCNVGDTPGSQDQGGGRRRRSRRRRRRSRRHRRQRGGGPQEEIVAHALTTFLIGAGLGLGAYGGWWALSATLGHFFPICGPNFFAQVGGGIIGRWLGDLSGKPGANPCVFNQQVWSAVITGILGAITAWWAAEGVAEATGGKSGFGPRARLRGLYNRLYTYILAMLNRGAVPTVEGAVGALGPGGDGGGGGGGGGDDAGGGGGGGGGWGDADAAMVLAALHGPQPQGGGRRGRSRRRSRRRRRSRHRSRRRRRTNRRKRRSRRRRR